MFSLDIVIVNWNAGEQLLNCVRSIQCSRLDKCVLGNVIIVDNASSDNSLELLPQWEKLSIIKSSSNLGFGRACNLGASHVMSGLVLFLNPDTELNIDSLEIATKFYTSNQINKIGILGVQLRDELGNIQSSCSRFPDIKIVLAESLGVSKFLPQFATIMRDRDYSQSQYVDQVMGAFFLLSRDLFNKIKGFDEDYFVYYEELDLSYRLHKLGYKSYFYVGTSIMHVGGGCSKQIKATRLFYVLDSKLIYVCKHFNFCSRVIAIGVTLFVEPLTRIVFFALKGDFAGVKETIAGYKLLYKKLL
jgi:N-acetylglucosaminyl-diphospho-decaprenol L-rhamnosyltransferase